MQCGSEIRSGVRISAAHQIESAGLKRRADTVRQSDEAGVGE